MKIYGNTSKVIAALLMLLALVTLTGGAALAQDDTAVGGEEVTTGDAGVTVTSSGSFIEDNLLLTIFGGTMSALALSALLLALGAWLYPRLKHEEQGYLYESEIESVLLPLIHDAVHTVHEMTITRLREIGGAELDAAQKQALFAELYRLTVPAELKRLVSLEQWCDWGQGVYDSGRNTVLTWADHLDDALKEWDAEAA